MNRNKEKNNSRRVKHNKAETLVPVKLLLKVPRALGITHGRDTTALLPSFLCQLLGSGI